MYSKITHNIVEEHFDGMPMTSPKKLTGIYDNVLLENTPRAIALRQDSRDLFTQYNSALREYLISLTNSGGDSTMIKSKINGLANNFTNFMTGNWYPIDRVTPVIDAWKTVVTDIQSVIDAIVAKQDRGPAVDKARSDIGALAQSMVVAAQPTGNLLWTIDGTSTLLNSYLDDIIEETVARSEQNWTKDQDSAMSAYTKLVTGTDSMASLADVISLGIIRQVPYSFQSLT